MGLFEHFSAWFQRLFQSVWVPDRITSQVSLFSEHAASSVCLTGQTSIADV